MKAKLRPNPLCAFAAAWITLVMSAHGDELGTIPHLDEPGFREYQSFTQGAMHRAFAIAPGGAWAWVSGIATAEVAEAEALKGCREQSDQPCHIYAVDADVVFDESAWLKSWNLSSDAAGTTVGLVRGQRFPNLVLTSPDGLLKTLKDLRGKTVFLHFWGSWCPPCQTEFADLQKLHDALISNDAVTFVLVQGREPIAKSKRWVEKNGFTMPLYDSGHQSRRDKSFLAADGEMIADRRLASVYPSSYILDANGVIVFHRAGPEKQWEEYENLLLNLSR